MRESVSTPHAATLLTSSSAERQASLVSPTSPRSDHHHVNFDTAAAVRETPASGGHQVTYSDNPQEGTELYDFHADHQAQLRRVEQERLDAAAAKKEKKKKAKNNAWSYILAQFNRPALLNILWILIAYIASFYNRVHVQVGAPKLREQGVLSADDFGTINAASYGVQFVSKFMSGFITDYFKRPKATFLVAAFGATLCSIGMVFWSTPAGFGVLYSAIKFLAAFGRVCLLKIIATWWPKEVMGSLGAVINVSSSLGEVTSRFCAASILQVMGWRGVWMILAAIAGALCIPMLFFTQDRPPMSFQALRPTLAQYNHMLLTGEPIELKKCDDEEVVTEHEHVPVPGGMKEIKVISDEKGALEEIMKVEEVERNFFKDVMIPLLRKPKLYVVLILAFCSTGLRESLVSWIGYYFQFALGMSADQATLWSPILHLGIMPSSFVGGYLLDRVSKKKRGLVPIFFLSANLFAMVALFCFTKYYLAGLEGFDNKSFIYALCLFLFACFCFSAPNSFLDGVYVVEMAGAEGAAFASGVVGAVGYCGAAASSLLFKKMSESRDGWCQILMIMMGAAVISWIGVIVYWQLDLMDIRRAERRASRHSSRAASRAASTRRPHLDLMVEVPETHQVRRMSESEAKAMHVPEEAVKDIVIHPESSRSSSSNDT